MNQRVLHRYAAPTLQPPAIHPPQTVRLTMAQALVRWLAAQLVTSGRQ